MKDIFHKVYGNAFGNILLALIATMFLITAIESVGVEAITIKTNIFDETPIWYLIAFFVIPALYPLLKGYVSIFLAAIITVIFVYLSEIITGAFSLQYKHFDYILPILSSGITKELILCTMQILGLYGALFIILPYITHVISKKTLRRDFIIGIAIVIAVSLFSCISMLATFGPYRGGNIFFPKLLETQRISFGGFIEFGELFAVLQVVSGWFIKYILAMYSIILLYQNLFERNKIFYYALSIIVFIAAYLSCRNNIAFFKLLNYYSYISLVVYILLPLITFILFSLKREKN
ncbi:GerAB/ArcD/ProY family transporter [Alloiococcus sp. CFN-8]|uniref:GerAB/ArcD/ProY family transporter n=1 Tax=Alloiococcus sp. CFN-8 TaxID=3416081 RepID=UPI003CED8F91